MGCAGSKAAKPEQPEAELTASPRKKTHLEVIPEDEEAQFETPGPTDPNYFAAELRQSERQNDLKHSATDASVESVTGAHGVKRRSSGILQTMTHSIDALRNSMGRSGLVRFGSRTGDGSGEIKRTKRPKGPKRHRVSMITYMSRTIRPKKLRNVRPPPEVRGTLMKTSNPNRPADYEWLGELLSDISFHQAHTLLTGGDGSKMTPLLVMYGACPNSFAPMQAIVYGCAADESAAKPSVDFWWIKPTKEKHTMLEPMTLQRRDKQPWKNDPGRSKPVYAPIAGMFENNEHKGKVEFKLILCTDAPPEADETQMRAMETWPKDGPQSASSGDETARNEPEAAKTWPKGTISDALAFDSPKSPPKNNRASVETVKENEFAGFKEADVDAREQADDGSKRAPSDAPAQTEDANLSFMQGSDTLNPRLKQQWRAVIIDRSREVEEWLYVLAIWQEDWTSSPWGKKYIKGRIVYQRGDGEGIEAGKENTWFSKQYEVVEQEFKLSVFEDECDEKLKHCDAQLKTLYTELDKK